jgi:hypothetical protein
MSVDSSSPVPQGETDQHSSISCGRKENEANAGTRVGVRSNRRVECDKIEAGIIIRPLEHV